MLRIAFHCLLGKKLCVSFKNVHLLFLLKYQCFCLGIQKYKLHSFPLCYNLYYVRNVVCNQQTNRGHPYILWPSIYIVSGPSNCILGLYLYWINTTIMSTICDLVHLLYINTSDFLTKQKIITKLCSLRHVQLLILTNH